MVIMQNIQDFFKKILSLVRINYSTRLNEAHGKGAFSENIGLLSDDFVYKRQFERLIGPKLYNSHIRENIICCAFCEHLKRSYCHENCFKCSKGTYTECSTLIPGIYNFNDSYFDSIDSNFRPWIFNTPCTYFERLDEKNYFRNFTSPDQSISIANYEALEGIFTGISREKRPCHICASVNIGIFNNCAKSEKSMVNKPCYEILNEISKIYRASTGMIRYEE
jgi:hypothetical protein